MRALLSVYDKAGIVELAAGLHELGWDLVSSGGTASVSPRPASPSPTSPTSPASRRSSGTGWSPCTPRCTAASSPTPTDPEHRGRHGGLRHRGHRPRGGQPLPVLGRARRSSSSTSAARPWCGRRPRTTPTSASSPTRRDYDEVLDELRANGALSPTTRRRSPATPSPTPPPTTPRSWPGSTPDADPASRRRRRRRAGQLPHLELALDRARCCATARTPTRSAPATPAAASRAGGTASCSTAARTLSYLNVYDADAAWQLAALARRRPARRCVIKHANPCGAAVADDILTAYQRAHECDPVSAFGGIVAVNRPVDAWRWPRRSQPVFTEVVIAPGYDAGALDAPRKRKEEPAHPRGPGPGDARARPCARSTAASSCRPPTTSPSTARHWRVVTERQPTEAEWADLELAWRVVAKVNSNSIVLVKDGTAVGIGCGPAEPPRRRPHRGEKAAGRAVGGAYASDAFFPFPDGLEARRRGRGRRRGPARWIDPRRRGHRRRRRAGLAMVFTGERHFRH